MDRYLLWRVTVLRFEDVSTRLLACGDDDEPVKLGTLDRSDLHLGESLHDRGDSIAVTDYENDPPRVLGENSPGKQRSMLRQLGAIDGNLSHGDMQ